MSEYYTVITQKGLEVLTDCIENGTAFPAAKISVGDSNGSYYEPSDTQTVLKNTKYTGELYAKGKKSGYLYFDLQLPPSEGDYYIREVGLFDNDDNLLAVAKYPESYKQKSDDGSNKSLLIELQILLSNEAINTIVIDDSGNLATLEELEDYQKLSEKGEANGYSPLDDNGFVPQKHLLSPNYKVFCINTGNTGTSGKPAFLSLSNNVLSTSGSFDITTANGNTYTVKDTLTLDISDYDDGDYNVYVNPVDLTLSVKSHTLTAGRAFPYNAALGDYLLNTSQIPYDLQEKTDSGVTKGLNEVYAGTLTISSGDISVDY
ncbi:MAG: phage tail protein [Candidatus Gastranaerophilales bacterium]|nr:phage tail protein [Candidatus Gastranaerophilales bacterium]